MPTMTSTEKTVLLRNAEEYADAMASRCGRTRICGPQFDADDPHGRFSVVVEGLDGDRVRERVRMHLDGTTSSAGAIDTPTVEEDRRVSNRGRAARGSGSESNDSDMACSRCGEADPSRCECRSLTEGQDRAFAFLNDRYGDCRIVPLEGARVKLEAVDDDGEVRARWYVEPDGRVRNAWDPDYSLDVYEARS